MPAKCFKISNASLMPGLPDFLLAGVINAAFQARVLDLLITLFMFAKN